MISRELSYVVLGGGGFLGTNLCRRLASSGHRVRAFGRRCLFPEALENVEWFQGDFSDVTTLAAAIETYDVVFHLVCATTPHSANLDPTADLRQNVLPSLALLDVSRKLNIKRIIFVSSGGTIYGLGRQIPTPETAATEPITAYGISKLAIERYLALYEYLYGLDFRVLRVANPYGPFQMATKNQGLIAMLISRALNGESIEIWGDGSVTRDYLFVEDVIDALEAVANDKSDARIFNIGSGRGRSVLDVVAAVEMVLDKKLKMEWKRGRPVDIPISVLSIERAYNILGWVPKTSFETGLKSTVDWWRTLHTQ